MTPAMILDVDDLTRAREEDLFFFFFIVFVWNIVKWNIVKHILTYMYFFISQINDSRKRQISDV